MLERLKNDRLLLRPVETYLKVQNWQAAALYQAFELNESGDLLHIKEGFEVYVCANGIEVIGLIIGGPSGLVFVHFSDEKVKSQYSVMKTLLTLRPNCLIGNPSSCQWALDILRKSIVAEEVEICHFMSFNRALVAQNHRLELLRDLKIRSSDGYEVKTANEVPFGELIPFLIEVEKSFNRNPLSINQLKRKMHERVREEAYLLMIKDGVAIAQGLLEYALPAHKLLGGIYTVAKYRGHGIGKIITRALVEVVLEQDKTPALTVEASNENAIKLYETLGFEIVAQQWRAYIKIQA